MAYQVSRDIVSLNINNWVIPAFINTWTNYGAPYSTAQYRKLPDGTVEFKGSIKKATAATSNEIIFNLPVTFRPLEYRAYGVISNNGIGRIDVQSNGDVVFGFGSNVWMSLEGIRFVAEA